MSEQVVYVDRFQLREGRLDDFKRYATEVAAFVEENEPGVISFNYYVEEGGSSGTAIFVFPDADALDLHLDLVSSRFQEGYELLSAADIELLGQPSDRAIEAGNSFNARVKTKLAGFSRH
ncbi:MAG: hypothetical protein ACRD1T_01415 [Acidimicrobiia bacterium]